jgi:nitroimidazol reductase NimA-like FMN-containing flavoprotein (pyridoxamine 5'-phosphate oxidase superfamily)
MPKSLSEVSSFMQKEWLASFATVDAEGRPHVVPVFFTYDKGRVYVQTDRKSVKVRNLAKNSNVAIAVYRGEEAVIIRGKGKVIADKNEFIKRTQKHIDKYRLQLDEHGRDSMGIPLFDAKIRCVIEVVPEKILFW